MHISQYKIYILHMHQFMRFNELPTVRPVTDTLTESIIGPGLITLGKRILVVKPVEAGVKEY